MFHVTRTPEPARLTVDLSALKANYASLCAKARGTRVSGIVKSNAYGMGAIPVAKALQEAGCDLLFATRANEGAELRKGGIKGDIYILDGLAADGPERFHLFGLIPVLNSLAELAKWREVAKARGETLPAAIHFDTGMTRLGLPAHEVDILASDPSLLENVNVTFWMSHLACGDERDNPHNARQLERFRAGLARLPEAKASLANSAGIYLGPDYHFDICRPGVALHGLRPSPEMGNGLKLVPTAEARVLQTYDIEAGESVGYGATWTAKRPSRIATIALGYADGYPWTLGNKGFVAFEGLRASVVGRVSMDLLSVDVTDLPGEISQVGTWAQTLGPHVTPQELAKAAGTLPYELLTSLGKRYTRRYV